MDKVSGLGSRIHSYIENDLKGTPLKDSEIQEDMLAAIESWEQFKSEHKIELIESERIVYSPKYRIAGTCDVILKLDGKLYVGDWKTGGIFPSAFTQTAAYLSFLKEEPKSKRIKGIENAGIIVLGVHRDGGAVTVNTLDSYYKGRVTIADELGVFHSLRYIWAIRNLKSRKWEPIIKNMADIISPLEQRFKKAFDL